jgi:hypothetical protein
MNASKTDADVFAILAVAQANWPHDPVAGSEAVWTKWRELLAMYSFEEVRATLDALARTHSRLPPLAELLSALTWILAPDCSALSARVLGPSRVC